MKLSLAYPASHYIAIIVLYESTTNCCGTIVTAQFVTLRICEAQFVTRPICKMLNISCNVLGCMVHVKMTVPRGL